MPIYNSENIKYLRNDYDKDFIMPVYATEGSAGLDLFASIEEELLIKPKAILNIPTGIAIHIGNKNIAGFVFSRSGLSSKYGIGLVNSVGVIDSDYVGEIICPMINHSEKNYIIKPEDRIAQIIFMPIYTANFILTDKFDNTKRGAGGFGSTGR